MRVSLREVAFTCGRCGEVYRDGLLVGGFVRLVVRDADGRSPACADLLDDPLVDLLAQVSAERSGLFARVAVEPADVTGAYLRLCDPSPSGAAWEREALPCCPTCGAQPSASERLDGLLQVDLPVLRHDALDALPREEQRARASAALRPATPGGPARPRA